jgi:hypothetical protein
LVGRIMNRQGGAVLQTTHNVAGRQVMSCAARNIISLLPATVPLVM